MKTVCIYHSPCIDGFTAAWCVKQAIPDAEFIPAKYQEDPPDVTGAQVYLVDFSYKREVIEKMLETCESMVIIDHHKSAREDLMDLSHPKLTTFMSMTASGARLAWEYFRPYRLPCGTRITHFSYVPETILAVEDHDLWAFKLSTTKAAFEAISSLEQTFEVWDTLMDTLAFDKLVSDGNVLLRKKDRDIQGILKSTKRTMAIGGVIVPAANVPYLYASDAGNIMAKEAPFAVTYFDGPEGRQFSLRSCAEVADATDVSKVAAIYGGGGHKHAAGFRMPIGWEGDDPTGYGRLWKALNG